MGTGRRDQIIDLIRDVEHATVSPEQAAGRIPRPAQVVE